MSVNETREMVPAHAVLGDLLVAPLPEGTAAEAVFMLVKLDDGEWCARSIGENYNRSEFLGELSSYTHALLLDEAGAWFPDGDART